MRQRLALRLAVALACAACAGAYTLPRRALSPKEKRHGRSPVLTPGDGPSAKDFSPDARARALGLLRPLARRARSVKAQVVDASAAEYEGTELGTYGYDESGPGANSPQRARKRRWLILGLYSAVSILNFGMWLTYATLPTATSASFAGYQLWYGHALGIIVGFGYLVGAVPAGKVLAGAGGGLRSGMLWASAINVLSAVLRWAGGASRSFWLALTGQALVGIAQPFFMAAPVQVSTEWFPKREQGVATSVAIMSQVLGQAAIFLVGPAVGALEPLILAQGVGSVALMLLVWRMFIQSDYRTDGCEIQSYDDGPDEGDAAPSASRQFGLLTVASGACIGAFWTFCTIIGQLLLPLGYTEAQIGYVGFSFIASGMAGLLCAGPVMDATRAYRKLMLACVWAASVSGLALIGVASAANFIPLIGVCSVLGFWLTAIQAVALETAAEITYPMEESTSSGVIFAVAVGVYCVLPFLVMKAGLRTVLWGQFGLFAATSLLLTKFFRPRYVRSERLEACYN